MSDTNEIITRLRSQHIDIARCAADAIERLVAAEAEARDSLCAMRQNYAALEAELKGQLDSRGLAQGGLSASQHSAG